MPKKPPQSSEESKDKISMAIRYACEAKFGVLDSNFLCQSVSILNLAKPICVSLTDTVQAVRERLSANRIGCVLVVDTAGKLKGIFSERDYILKISDKYEQVKSQAVSLYMTAEPMAEMAQATLAYVLNLMSQGGFRHMPIVDSDNIPIGIVSIKDVVDYIVNSFMDDIMSFNPEMSGAP